jgi:hypothetical protein
LFGLWNKFIIEVDWKIRGASWWGIRYVDVEYLASMIDGIQIAAFGTPASIDGSYVGVMFHMGF